MNQIPYLSVEQQFQRNAEELADKPALIKCDSKGVHGSYSYQALNQRANRYANYLQSNKIMPASPVVVFMTDPMETIAAMIGIMKMGAIFVPLNPADFPQRSLDLLREIRPAFIIVDDENIGQLENAFAPDSISIAYINVNRSQFTKFADDSQLQYDADLDEICYVYYSSGTTGKPKGITGTRRGISHFVRWESQTLVLTHGVRISQWTQPFYDAFLRDVFVPLCCGGTIVAPPSKDTILNASALIQWINSTEIEVIHTIPTIFHRIIQESVNSEDFRKLRYVLLAGERVLTGDVQRCFEIFGERIQLLNLYGPSETVMTKLFYIIKPGDEARRSIPIGRPMPDVEVVLLDGAGAPVPAGSIGEIAISPGFNMPGYFRQPEMTDLAYVNCSHVKRGIIYKTGDYGRLLENGEMEFLGRKDQQVKINGIRVELAEVENLLSTHPAIKENVVQLLQQNHKPDSHHLVAWVSGELPATTIDKEMYEYLENKIPPYLIPNYYVLIDRLPRLPNGKINYKALPKFDFRAVGEKRQSFFEEIFENAYELTEIKLTRIWEHALNRVNIRLNDNFFQLGGDSLMVFTVISEVKKQLNYDLPLSMFLKNPTIAQLAKVIRGENAPNHSIVVPLHTQGDKTPFWCIHPPGGNVLTYAKLAYRIGETHPFYAIQHPILSGQKGNDKLEDLASDYLTQLLDVQPSGPYILSGWSMGGIVAIEMARQLMARRHDVTSVILFDSEWPYPRNSDVTDRVQWVEKRAFTSLLRFLGEGFGVTPKEHELLYSQGVLRGILNLTAQQFMGVSFSRKEQKRFPREWLWITDQVLEKLIGFNAMPGFVPYGILSRLAPSQQTKWLLRLLRLLHKIPDNFNPVNVIAFMDAFRQHLQCVCRYKPKPVDIKLALFITGDESSYNLEGWKTCTTKELETYSTPGNHFTLLTEPNVGELAKKILKIIP